MKGIICVNLCVCVFIYAWCMNVCVCVYVVCECVYVYECMCMCVHVCMCMYVHKYVCVYWWCMCVYVCVALYAHIFVQLHIHVPIHMFGGKRLTVSIFLQFFFWVNLKLMNLQRLAGQGPSGILLLPFFPPCKFGANGNTLPLPTVYMVSTSPNSAVHQVFMPPVQAFSHIRHLSWWCI